MSAKVGSGIIKNGLILHLDAASPTNYLLSSVEVLVVAGGGGGGWDVGGGGGGGGVCYAKSYPVTPGTAISVTVGAGGAGANVGTGAGRSGSGGRAGDNGANSVFGTITALGGGGGGGWSNVSGSSGGSGGGQVSNSTDAAYSATQGSGAFHVGYGNPGGISARNTSPGDNNYSGASGGGGAGGPGGGGINDGTWTLNSALAGFGGPGLPFDISGTTQYYGGGGGASSDNSIYTGVGGIGGGGSAEKNGTPNTGGGGGGGGLPTNIGGTGGSGIVIVRYPGPQKATGGNTITQVDGYTIHTFTSSTGTFTPLTSPTNGGTVYGFQDLSGNIYSGVSVNGPITYSTDKNGSISFDGINDYLNISGFDAQLNPSFSLFCWVILNTTSGNRGIWGHGGVNSNNSHFEVNNSLWRVRLGTVNNSSITTATPNVWQNVGFTCTGSLVSFYINGSLVTSWSGETGLIFGGGFTGTTTKDQQIGDSNIPARPLDGKIAQLSIYNRTLTPTEITQNFNTLRGRFGI